jgi:heme/copper-type cytochrome/quinol oxidase subunit 2
VIVASSYLFFPKEDQSKSYQIAKNSLILVMGILIWSVLAYQFRKVSKEIHDSLSELTLLESGHTLAEMTHLKHMVLMFIVVIVFLASAILDFFKQNSVNFDLNHNRAIELISFDI